jgi:DnaK suppressor protein
VTIWSGPVDASGSPLTAEQHAELRKILVAHVRASLDQAAAHEAVARELAVHSDADSVIERELAELGAAQARAVAQQAEQALARLEDGTYGFCESCGAAIPRERLEALPHVRRCVACSSSTART